MEAKGREALCKSGGLCREVHLQRRGVPAPDWRVEEARGDRQVSAQAEHFWGVGHLGRALHYGPQRDVPLRGDRFPHRHGGLAVDAEDKAKVCWVHQARPALAAVIAVNLHCTSLSLITVQHGGTASTGRAGASPMTERELVCSAVGQYLHRCVGWIQADRHHVSQRAITRRRHHPPDANDAILSHAACTTHHLFSQQTPHSSALCISSACSPWDSRTKLRPVPGVVEKQTSFRGAGGDLPVCQTRRKSREGIVAGRAWGGKPGRGRARSGWCLRAQMALSRCGSTQYLSRTLSAMSRSSTACHPGVSAFPVRHIAPNKSIQVVPTHECRTARDIRALQTCFTALHNLGGPSWCMRKPAHKDEGHLGVVGEAAQLVREGFILIVAWNSLAVDRDAIQEWQLPVAPSGLQRKQVLRDIMPHDACISQGNALSCIYAGKPLGLCSSCLQPCRWWQGHGADLPLDRPPDLGNRNVVFIPGRDALLRSLMHTRKAVRLQQHEALVGHERHALVRQQHVLLVRVRACPARPPALAQPRQSRSSLHSTPHQSLAHLLHPSLCRHPTPHTGQHVVTNIGDCMNIALMPSNATGWLSASGCVFSVQDGERTNSLRICAWCACHVSTGAGYLGEVGKADLGVRARAHKGLQLTVAAYGARQPSPLDSAGVVAELSQYGVAAGVDALECWGHEIQRSTDRLCCHSNQPLTQALHKACKQSLYSPQLPPTLLNFEGAWVCASGCPESRHSRPASKCQPIDNSKARSVKQQALLARDALPNMEGATQTLQVKGEHLLRRYERPAGAWWQGQWSRGRSPAQGRPLPLPTPHPRCRWLAAVALPRALPPTSGRRPGRQRRATEHPGRPRHPRRCQSCAGSSVPHPPAGPAATSARILLWPLSNEQAACKKILYADSLTGMKRGCVP